MSAFGAVGFGQSDVLDWERMNSRPDARPAVMNCGEGGLTCHEFLIGKTCGEV